MVFYFLSTVCDPPTVLFMGRDKHENEDLIKHGWPEDVWFHVDKVTAAEKMRVRKEQNIFIAGLLGSRLPPPGTRTDPRKCEFPLSPGVISCILIVARHSSSPRK